MIVAEITLILVAAWLVAKFGEREWALLETDRVQAASEVGRGDDGKTLPYRSVSESARLDAAEIYDWERE